MEVKSRDLDGRLYLAMRCAQAGHPVLLGLRARVRRFVRKDLAGPVYYISKGNRPVEEIYSPIEKFGGYLFLLDEEGAGNLSYNVHVNHPFVLTQEHVEKIFIWGELQKEYLIKNGALPEKLKVTGAPRFDLLKPGLIDFYHKLSKRLNKPEKYIVVASNQASANPSLGVESTKQHLKSIFQGRHGTGNYSVEQFMVEHELDTHRLDKLLELTRAIAREYPDLTVVYRPHPAEEMAFYDGKFTEPNILVTREGNSLEWIVDECAHIHIDCTTGIEAFLVGKEVISYIPQEDNGNLTEATISVSSVYRTEDGVIQHVGRILKNGMSTIDEEERQEKTDRIGQLFANVRLDSAQAIIDALPPYAGPITPQIPKPKSLAYRTAKKIRKFVKGDRLNDLDLRAKQKFPGLSLDEVRIKIDVLQQVMPSLPDVRVREFDIDTFLIEPR